MIFFGFSSPGRFLQLLAQLVGSRLEVDRGQHLADRFRTDVRGEGVGAVLVLRVEEFFLGHQLAIGQVGQARLDDDVVLEVENPLQIAQRHVQHQADAAGQRLQEPDVRDGGGQFDMAHPLAPHLLERHFHAALLADDAAILHALVLAAEALVVLDRPEDPRAEQPVTLGLERAVVDGFRLLDLAIGPREDPLGAGQRDLDLVEGLDGATGLNGFVESSWFIFTSLKRGRGGGTGGGRADFSTKSQKFRRNFGPSHHSSSSASRSSMLRPRPRTSLTRTLNDSGTPASKLSSPLTINS